MMKNLGLWFLLTAIIGVVLFNTISVISTTTFTNIFSEFEILLNLIGISVILSTLIVCTKLILNKMGTEEK